MWKHYEVTLDMEEKEFIKLNWIGIMTMAKSISQWNLTWRKLCTNSTTQNQPNRRTHHTHTSPPNLDKLNNIVNMIISPCWKEEIKTYATGYRKIFMVHVHCWWNAAHTSQCTCLLTSQIHRKNDAMSETIPSLLHHAGAHHLDISKKWNDPHST